MTATSTFGTSRREGHDASMFYARRLAVVEFDSCTTTVEVPADVRDRIFAHTSETMHELPDNSVALVVTSCPYHVGKDYDTDASFGEFLAMLDRVFREVHRILEPGGRIALNVANLGRAPYVPFTHRVSDLLGAIGFHMRGEIIWQKAAGAGGSTAWGSWCSASNPVLRDVHEYVLVFSKARMSRAHRGDSTIERDAFLRDTLSVWNIPAESATRVGHPAPFPVELPRRLIDLYTYAGDVVVDPFMGSGSTALGAIDLGRSFVGYDTDAGYVDLAHGRIARHRSGVGVVDDLMRWKKPPTPARRRAKSTPDRAGLERFVAALAARPGRWGQYRPGVGHDGTIRAQLTRLDDRLTTSLRTRNDGFFDVYARIHAAT